METRVDKLFADITAKLTDEEKAGRIDIGYRKTAGKHVIIELKRPSVSTTLSELIKQIEKYYSGLAKILEDMGTPHDPIEIVLLLGRPPAEWKSPGGKKRVENVLSEYGARFVLYDQLLNSAFEAYRDYTAKRKTVDRLQEVIQAIEDYAPDED